MWDSLVEQANLRADQYLNRNGDLSPLKLFFAVVIVMGLKRETDLADYWSFHEIGDTPLFGKHVERTDLSECWHI